MVADWSYNLKWTYIQTTRPNVHIMNSKEEATNLRVCGGSIEDVRGWRGRSGNENTVLTYGL